MHTVFCSLNIYLLQDNINALYFGWIIAYVSLAYRNTELNYVGQSKIDNTIAEFMDLISF